MQLEDQGKESELMILGDLHDGVIYYEDQSALSCFYCQANISNIIVSLFAGEKINLNNTAF